MRWMCLDIVQVHPLFELEYVSLEIMKADSPTQNSPIPLPATKLDNLQSATNSNYCRTTQTPGPQAKENTDKTRER